MVTALGIEYCLEVEVTKRKFTPHVVFILSIYSPRTHIMATTGSAEIILKTFRCFSPNIEFFLRQLQNVKENNHM